MKISCPSCRAAFQLDDSRVPPAGLAIKCPRCKGAFTVQRPKAGEEDRIVEGKSAGSSAVPLPAGPRGAPAGSGAVPLPGNSDGPGRAAAGPPPARGGSAVPLPGQGAPQAPRPPPAAASDDPFGLDDPAPAPPAPAAAARSPASGDGDPLDSDPFGDTPPAAAPRPSPKSSAPIDGDPFSLDDEPQGPAGGAPVRNPAAGSGDGLDFDFVEAKAATPAPARSTPPPASPKASEGHGLELDDGRPPPPPSRKSPPRAPPPPVMNARPATASSDAVGEAEEPAAPGKPSRAPPSLRRAGSGFRIRPAAVAFGLAGVALLAVLALGVRAASTPAGLFWRNRFFAPSAPSAATSRVVEAGKARLADGTFSGARAALASAAQLLAAAPKDDEARAFYVLCASEMRAAYGQTGADWDQAQRVLSDLKGEGPAQQRARAAQGLAAGDLPRARTLLAAVEGDPSPDVESTWLYAQAVLRGGDPARAGQVLDRGLKAHPVPKLLVARGLVEVRRGKPDEAAKWFGQVLAKSPDHGRALIEMAELKVAALEGPAAAELSDRALGPDVRKTLDASEEARANLVRARVLAQGHDAKGAEAAFDRAVALDPASVEVRAAYGAFRLKRREFDKATRQYEAALALPGVPASAIGQAALAYLGANRWVEADKRASEAGARDPSDPHLLYVQGRVAEVMGRGEDPEKFYDKALAKKPELIEALIAKGQLAFAKGDKDRARQALAQAVKTPEPGRSAEDEAGIGELSLSLGDVDGAREAFAGAIRRDPDDAHAHLGLGRALSAQGNLRAAREEMERALRLTDADAQLFYEYGSLLRRIGESDAALAALQKAVSLDGKEARYRARLGALLVERGAFAPAEEELRKATLSGDTLSEGWFFLGRARAGLKRLPEAVDTLKKAVELEPDNAEYLYHLGLVYETGQQVQNAVDAFSKSVAKAPRNPDAQEHLGINLMVQNRYEEAADAFKQAAQMAPTRARIWALLGDAQQQGGQIDAAIGNLSRAVKQDPNLGGAWSRLGVAYKDKACSTCKTHAIEALRRATQVNPKDATAWHELGYLYKDDSRRADSIAAFRKYLELRPESTDAETVKDEIYYLQEESRRAP